MPRAFTTRKWELTSRGRDYQLIPTFPRLPGIIPESPASETTLASRPLRKPSAELFRLGFFGSHRILEWNLRDRHALGRSKKRSPEIANV